MEQQADTQDTQWMPSWARVSGTILIGVLGVLVIIALDQSWSPEAWAALGTWATAAIAATAGAIALGQLGEARQLRKAHSRSQREAIEEQRRLEREAREEQSRIRFEESQPYVIATMEANAEVDARFMDLVIKNLGKTPALNVAISSDPPLRRATGGGFDDVWVPDCIPVLVPRQEWRTLWDFAPRRAGSGLPDQHDVRVTFDDTRGNQHEYTFVLDWGAYAGRMQVTTYGLHHAAKALREIDRKFGRWQESIHGGLSVYVRDGDAKDQRQREELDEGDRWEATGGSTDPTDEQETSDLHDHPSAEPD